MKILARFLLLCVLLAGLFVSPALRLHAQTISYTAGAVNFGSANVCAPGKSAPAPCSSTATLTYTVTSAGTLGTPKVLTLGAPNLDFKLTGGTCTGSVSSGTCTVQVAFAPLYPGARAGAVQIVSGSGTVLATAFIHGIGVGPQITISGSPSSVLLTSLGPNMLWTSVAIDGLGNTFLSNGGRPIDTPGSAVIYELPAGGGALKPIGGGFSGVAGIAVDGAGSVYVVDYGLNELIEVPPGCFEAACESVRASGFSAPQQVVVAPDGTAYVSDTGLAQIVKLPLGCATVSCATLLGTGLRFPYGVALNTAGDLFFADSFGNAIYRIPAAGGAQSVVINGRNFLSNFAIDAAGDLLLVNGSGNQILERPTVSGTLRTIASDVVSPTSIALDGAGNIFVLQFANGVVLRKIARTQAGYNFASSNVGSTSSDSPVTFLVQNAGNTNLALSGLTLGTDPSFTQTLGTGTPEDCTGSLSLTPGNFCELNVSFLPSSAGPLTAAATFTDNSLNATAATQTIALSGTGLVPGTPIAFPNGFSPNAAALFAFNGGSAVTSAHLRLTDGGQFEDRSVFYSTRVNVNAFTTEFDFQLSGKNAPTPDADGFTFILQGNGPNAIGSGGAGLGYGPPGVGQAGPVITNSVAIKFDLHSNQGEGTSSTGLYINGALPAQPSVNTLPSGIDLHSGHVFHAALAYDGTTLTLTLKDETTNATFTQPFTVNIPAVVGGETAYAGFAGGTGANTAVQDILDWQFSSAPCCTAGMPNFPTGFPDSTSLFLINSEVNNNDLVMTLGTPLEATGAYQLGTDVPISRFATDFDFQSTDGVGDGFTFVVRSFTDTSELGSPGSGLGYGPGYSSNSITSSVAVKFDTHNNAGEGPDSTGIYTGGAAPTVPATDLRPSHINLQSSDVFHSRITYDGTNLKVSITDLTNYANFTQEYPVNIPAAVGSTTGFPGFTAGTGNSVNTLKILNWVMTSF